MEPSQVKLIQDNFVELISNTCCNVQLITRLQQLKTLHQCEVEDLQTLRQPLEVSRRLYEILMTKRNAFQHLVKALEEVHQTGALEILQGSKEKNQNIKPKMVDIALHKTRLKQIANQCLVLPEFFEKFLLDINTTDEFGNTMLHMVALFGESVISLAYLIDLGVDWKICNDRDFSVLHVAAQGGNYNLVQYLINIGIDVNCRTVEGDTPMHRIALAKKNFLETLDVLVKNGADINAVNNTGNNLVLAAAINGLGVKELRQIVKLGGDWSISDIMGNSVHHKAALCGNYQAIKYFTELGADTTSKNLDGDPPILYSVGTENMFLRTLKTFVENKADINAVDNRGENIFFQAVGQKKSSEELKEVIQLGGNWKALNYAGYSVLHLAARVGNVTAIKTFVQLGADVNIKDTDGCTPIHYVVGAQTHFLETLNALVECGADINVVNIDGENVLWCAVVAKRSLAEIKAIVELGGNWRASSNSGISVLDCCRSTHNLDALAYFRSLNNNN